MNSIDFLPEHIRAQRVRRRRLIRGVNLLVLCAVGLAALGYTRHESIQQARAEVDALAGRSATMRAQLAQRAELERQLGEMHVIERIDAQLGTRVNALDVLAELSKLMPDSISLTTMNLETIDVRVPLDSAYAQAGARPVEAGRQTRTRTVKRVRLVIVGMAPTDVDVANFIGQLSASPLFEEVTMGYARNKTFRRREAREFQASCYVVK